MVQRNILHKGFFAFIVTFLMAFLALPMGVFADNASDVSADTNAITWDSINGNNASQDNVTENLDSLPTTGTNGSTIVWSSNNTNVISNTGVVTRPTFSEGDKYVELQANLQKGQSFGGATFNLTVKALPPTDAEAVAAALAALTWDSIKGTNSAENNVTAPLTLPSSGSYVTTITWSSNNTAVITNIGSVIRPYSDAENASVTLTATFTKGSETATKAFNLTVIKKEIQTITISDTMSTGDIGSTKEYVLIEDNQVIIAGSKTNADSQLNLSMNPGKTMIWQAAYTSSAGTAISLYDGTFNMTGGSIVSAAGAAITTLGSAAVNISGGYVFGVGTAVPVAATVTSPGVVVSYDSTATGARKIGSSVGLSALPTGATAEWDIQGGVDGISYTLGGNTGFISGTGVDVIPISTDATLSSLLAGPYSLTPDFNKDTVSYRATVPYEVS
ncbi:MAG: hypothetical protein LBL80_05980, partial [Ruminococcus sp.]|nr:hypothetical protein [Ruminococcus sp.]